ncbi:MAG: hypothetical protein HYV63_27260 [Candidatus Schekmanbacteria bacterium]|nr:hypothetical protein [Candidatus Schekmanbacteria bacterium]
MKRYRILPAVLIAGFVLAAAAAADAQMQRDKGGTMRYSSTKQIKALDPITSTSLATLRMTSLIYESLVERDEFGTGLKPLLADKFESAPRLITFFLKHDIKWHDGAPFTAEDVAFTFKVLRNPKTETALRDEFKFVGDVSVKDAHTITFTFLDPVYKPEYRFMALKILPRHTFEVLDPEYTPTAKGEAQLRFPDVPLLSAPRADSRTTRELPNKAIISILESRGDYVRAKVLRAGPVGAEGWIEKFKDHIARDEGSFILHPIGTGPYKFESIGTRGINLRLNEEYHGDKAYIEFVRRTRAQDKNTMVNYLLNEFLNLLPDTPLEDIARIEKSGVAKTTQYSSLKFAGFVYNTQKKGLGKREMRRAMTLALNRSQLLETFYQGKGDIVAGPFAPDSWGVSLSLKPLGFDLDAANKLLDEAIGLPREDGSRRIEGQPAAYRLIISNEQNPADYNMCHAYKDAMAKVGIQVEVDTVEKGKYIDDLRAGDFDIAYLEWNFGISYNIKPIFHPEGLNNYGRYVNPEVGRLFDEMDRQNDGEARRELSYKIQEIIAEDAPYTFLWTLKNVASSSIHIRDIGPETIDPYEFFTWIERWYIPRDVQ